MTETSMPAVLFAQEQDLAWRPLKDTPGFGGVDIPGVELPPHDGARPWRTR